MKQNIKEADTVPQTKIHTETPASDSVEKRVLSDDILNNVPVAVVARLGQTSMTVEKLLSLAAKEVITLDTPLGGEIQLFVNDRLIAHGELVAVDEKFGVRVTQIATPSVA